MYITKSLFWLLLMLISIPGWSQTWDEWFRQSKTERKYMLEQIAKLQVYLEYVKTGYDISRKGLSLIGDIKNGDLSLHTIFFDHLRAVNPYVKKYYRVSEIITLQSKIIASCKNQFMKFQKDKVLNSGEVSYINDFFSQLLDKLSDNISLLTEVLTDGQLQMSDDQRVDIIDKIYYDVSGIYSTTTSFVRHIETLCVQRKKELFDIENVRKLYEP